MIQHVKGHAALHYYLWRVWLNHIFLCYLIKGTTVGENSLNKIVLSVLKFSITLSEAFLMLRRIQRDVIITVHRSSCKVPVILVSFE